MRYCTTLMASLTLLLCISSELNSVKQVQLLENCDLSSLVVKLQSKELITQFPEITSDPYVLFDDREKKEVDDTIANKSKICALRYVDVEKVKYELKNFESEADASQAGYSVTHYGVCGVCSNLSDLSIYLSRDLTNVGRRCALLGFFSFRASVDCFKRIGFTEDCARIWFYDSQNTRKHCMVICLWSLFTRESNIVDGENNACIKCDEVKSGPIFKFLAGRNRRNSGIESELIRDRSEVPQIEHCQHLN